MDTASRRTPLQFQIDFAAFHIQISHSQQHIDHLDFNVGTALISDLKFQIGETAEAKTTANANAKANSRTPCANTEHGAPAKINADPSFLFLRGREAADKGVRDDNVDVFFAGCEAGGSLWHLGHDCPSICPGGLRARSHALMNR